MLYSKGGQTFLFAGQIYEAIFTSGSTLLSNMITIICGAEFFEPFILDFIIFGAYSDKIWTQIWSMQCFSK